MALDVPGFDAALVSLPSGDVARQPVLIAAHGAGDNPAWQCEAWRAVLGDRAVILCLSGPREYPRSEGRYFPDHFALEKITVASLEALRRVLLPLLAPAIFAAAMIAFALSLDDFLISAFLIGGQDSITVPVLIYETARSGPSPALNAVATLLLLGSLLAIGLIVLVQRLVDKRHETSSKPTVQSLAKLEL